MPDDEHSRVPAPEDPALFGASPDLAAEVERFSAWLRAHPDALAKFVTGSPDVVLERVREELAMLILALDTELSARTGARPR